jgi:hypothetical protein
MIGSSVLVRVVPVTREKLAALSHRLAKMSEPTSKTKSNKGETNE